MVKEHSLTLMEESMWENTRMVIEMVKEFLLGLNGGKYVGEYKDGKKNGQGTLTYTDGRMYEGEWKNGKQNGQGTETFPDGGKYVGEYKDGLRHGQGTTTFYDGDCSFPF